MALHQVRGRERHLKLDVDCYCPHDQHIGIGMAATCVVQPVDLIKTRMQLATTGGQNVAKPYVWLSAQILGVICAHDINFEIFSDMIHVALCKPPRCKKFKWLFNDCANGSGIRGNIWFI